MRVSKRIVWTGCGTFLVAAATVFAAEGAREIGAQRQLFIDQRFLGAAQGVELRVHPPVKTYERTVVATEPWERGHVGCYSSVLFADGVYHMWYRAGAGMCYARSKDGVTWEKPELGIVEYKGSKKNNISLGGEVDGVPVAGEGGMVFIDPTAPPAEKFRMLIKRGEPAVIDPNNPPDCCIFSSPDGLRWKLTHEHVITFTEPSGKQHLDSQNVVWWDDRIGKYVAYMRRNMRDKGPRYRTIARSESKDLKGFQQVQDSPVVIGPDEYDDRFGPRPGVDYYTNAAIKYPWAQDAYFMFPVAYFHFMGKVLPEFPNETPINAGVLDTQFAASRDGVKWERYDRRPFIPLGFTNAFDSRQARGFYGMVPSVDGQQLYLYYLGSNSDHGWPGKPNKKEDEAYAKANPEEAKRSIERRNRNIKLLTEGGFAPEKEASVISRVVCRMDGFVSVSAGVKGGEFTTEPLIFTGKELVLNVDTSAIGNVACELQNEKGEAIPGFALADCGLVHSCNQINRVVGWKGGRDLSALAGKPVRLKMKIVSADVYAFQFR